MDDLRTNLPDQVQVNLEQFEAEAKMQEMSGNGVVGITTAFPKNPPPPGIAYSKNFARFQKDGRFAQQTRD